MRALNQRQGWLIFVGIFLLFMLAGLFVSTHDRKSTGRVTARATNWLPSKWLSFTQTSGVVTEHPITSLMADAKVDFAKRLAKQSKTLPEAVAEYKRRYQRDPPRGFDDWWAFATENDFKFTDEFDGIVEDLAPFWTLSGEELRLRAFQVVRLVWRELDFLTGNYR